jgi:hypothetical protein
MFGRSQRDIEEEHTRQFEAEMRRKDQRDHETLVRKITLLKSAGNALHRAADVLSTSTYDTRNQDVFALDRVRKAEVDAALQMLETAGFISTEIERVR